MLLELCDTTLKDWLSDNSTVNLDMLEDIMIFALNVARAVQFLHSLKVTSLFTALTLNNASIGRMAYWTIGLMD